MVATIRSISSGSNAAKYFYFTEKNFESSQSFHDSKGKKELGLTTLKQQTLENLLDGKLKSDLELGRKEKGGVKHHPGQELIFSAPKSVSIMALVAGDERVLSAHEKAVGTVLDYVEKHMIYTRIQAAGNLRYEKTDNAVFAKFTHLASRASKTLEGEERRKPDPQLHSHTLIINATKCQDSKWRSVVFNSLYDNKMHIGQLYRLELVRNVKALGYDINLSYDKKDRFTFEISGVPEKDLKEFSRRRVDIVEEAQKRGVKDAESLAYIAKITREDKEDYKLKDLKGDWGSRVTSLKSLEALKYMSIEKATGTVSETELSKNGQYIFGNLEGIHLSKAADKERDVLKGAPAVNLNKILKYSVSHLSEREAVWSVEKLHSAIIQKSGISLSVSDIESLTDMAIKEGKLLVSADKNQHTLTTHQNLKEEKHLVKLMRDLQGIVNPIMSRKEVLSLLDQDSNRNDLKKMEQTPGEVTGNIKSNESVGEGTKKQAFTLSQDQRDAVSLIFTTRDRIVGIQGISGSGKTTFLKTAEAIANTKNLEIIGTAPTKSAASTLSNAGITLTSHSGKRLESLSAFLEVYNYVIEDRVSEAGLTSIKQYFQNKTFILDEASMASITQMKGLLKLVNKFEMKLVPLGDFKQIGSVGRGKGFYTLQDNGMDTCVMGHIKRQKNESLLKSVYSFERLVDRPEREARSLVRHGLETLGKENIIDLSLMSEAGQGEKDKDTPAPYISNKQFAQATYEVWKNLVSEGKTPLIVVPSQALRREVNQLIRSSYVDVSKQEISHAIVLNKDLTEAQKKDAKNYNEGNILLFNKENKQLGITRSDYFSVKSVKGNILNIERESDQKVFKYSVSLNKLDNVHLKSRLNVYEQSSILLSSGERIKWTKNSPTSKFVINGNEAIIKEINSDKQEVVLDIGKHKDEKESNLVTLPLNNPDLKHIDYNYSTTSFSAQSKTTEIVIGVMRAKEEYLTLSTQRSLYVTVSRAEQRAILITDNYKGLVNKLARASGSKTSSIEHQELNSYRINLDNESKLRPINLSSQYRLVNLESSRSEEKIGVNIGEISFNTTETRSESTIDAKMFQQDTFNVRLSNYASFKNDKYSVRQVAMQAFGDINTKLSNGDNLKFGRKGSISVNLKEAKWFNHESAEGGSLYSFIKDKSIFDNSLTQENILGNSPTTSRISNEGELKVHSSSIANDITEKNSVESKLKYVGKLFAQSTPINATSIENQSPANQSNNLAVTYLREHRKIDTHDINLSKDVRFMPNAFSRETNSTHPALVVIARGEAGKISAAQVTYLDSSTANKSQSLNIQKRSLGVLKGSFVELSENKDSNTIFIAEGVETALSILRAQPDKRVLCSLGISNIPNIDLGPRQSLSNKSLIICADNDQGSTSRIVIDKAAQELSNKGFKSVSVIRPELVGQDFNDVLKSGGVKAVNRYIDSLTLKHPDYKANFKEIEKKLEFFNQNIKEINSKNISPDSESKYSRLANLYRSPREAQNALDSLIRSRGTLGALAQVKGNQGILGDLRGSGFMGFENLDRKEAKSNIKEALIDSRREILNKKLKALQERKYESLKKEIIGKGLSNIMSAATEGRFDGKKRALNVEELKISLESTVMKSLSLLDNKTDYASVKFVTEKCLEQINQYRNRFREEPSAKDKRDFFLKARYELERGPILSSIVKREMKLNSVGSVGSIDAQLKLDRIASIDSKLASQASKGLIYYKARSYKEVKEIYKEGEQKIGNLTKELMQKDKSFVNANFLATEIVKYEERYGARMPLMQREALTQVGEYVSKNFDTLVKGGLSENEAKIAYIEGSKLAANYSKESGGVVIRETQLKQIQLESKAIHSNPVASTPKAESPKSTSRSKSLELEI